jgi:zinc D-Ala-D-Ala carboxypeptidase
VSSRRARPFFGALLLISGYAGSGPATPVVAATSTSPRPGDPLPACLFARTSTRYESLDDWRKTLVDTQRMVASTYVPADLVSVAAAQVSGVGQVRRRVIADLGALAAAARDAGAGLAVRSAYRSYQSQKAVFKSKIRQYGYAEALRRSARAGHSEHQLGTTIDFRSADSTVAPWDYPDWGTTIVGAWVAANAARFGFVMSYPQGSLDETCYIYEPWHFRYVGRVLASRIAASGQTPRRYLWTHYETAA